MSLISGPSSFNFTGGGRTGFWPLQLIRPACMAFWSGWVDVGSAGLTAVMRAIG